MYIATLNHLQPFRIQYEIQRHLIFRLPRQNQKKKFDLKLLKQFKNSFTFTPHSLLFSTTITNNSGNYTKSWSDYCKAKKQLRLLPWCNLFIMFSQIWDMNSCPFSMETEMLLLLLPLSSAEGWEWIRISCY